MEKTRGDGTVIRTIRSEEIGEMLTLTQTAFSVRFTEQEAEAWKSRIRAEDFLGFYVDGRLGAQLAVLPLQVYMQGKRMEIGGIAHVAAYPELRRQGMVGKLISRSLEQMRERGQTVSMLNPFAYGFYRKYGWEIFSEVKSLSLDIADLPTGGQAAGKVRRLNRSSDWETVDRVYHAYACGFNGMVARDEAWWKQMVYRRKNGELVCHEDENGEATGYMLYAVAERHMRIQEFVCLTEEARRGLWQFARYHDSVADTVSFSLPAAEPYLVRMSEPGAKQETSAQFMFRVVDAAGFLGKIRFAGSSGGKLAVRLTDAHAPWNEGMWSIEWDGEGQSRVVSVQEEAGTDELKQAIACDIQTFSAMMCGWMRPSQLVQCGKLGGQQAAVHAWEQALPAAVPYLIDMF